MRCNTKYVTVGVVTPSPTSQIFFKNEKVVREKGSQWGVLAHEGGVTSLFDVASMENEN